MAIITTLRYELHVGSNLVGFPFCVNEDCTQPLVGDFFTEYHPEIVGIIGEGVAAIRFGGGWIGSLITIDPHRGYWVTVTEDYNFDLEVWEGTPDFSAGTIHTGANLMSWGLTSCGESLDYTYELSTSLHPDLNDQLTGMIGEGVAAQNSTGEWMGSLSSLSPRNGYWVISNIDFADNWWDSELGCDCDYQTPPLVDCDNGSCAATADDCPDEPPETCEDQGLVTCWDGSCVDTYDNCLEEGNWVCGKDGSIHDSLEMEIGLAANTQQCYDVISIDPGGGYSKKWIAENNAQLHYTDGSPIGDDGVTGYHFDSADGASWDGTLWGEFSLLLPQVATLDSVNPYLCDPFTEDCSAVYNTDSITEKLGRFYNHKAAHQNYRNICPPGWHVPNMTEWEELIDAIGGFNQADKLRDTSWSSGDDIYNFSAIAAGEIKTFAGDWGWYFGNDETKFWSTSRYEGSNVGIGYRLTGGSSNDDIVRLASIGSSALSYGFSIRCLEGGPEVRPPEGTIRSWFMEKEDYSILNWQPAEECIIDPTCNEYVDPLASSTLSDKDFEAMKSAIVRRREEEPMRSECPTHPVIMVKGIGEVMIYDSGLNTFTGDMPWGCWRSDYKPSLTAFGDEIEPEALPTSAHDIGCCDNVYLSALWTIEEMYTFDLHDCDILDGYYYYMCGGCSCYLTPNPLGKWALADGRDETDEYNYLKPYHYGHNCQNGASSTDYCSADFSWNTLSPQHDGNIKAIGPTCPDKMCIGGEHDGKYCNENITGGVTQAQCEEGFDISNGWTENTPPVCFDFRPKLDDTNDNPYAGGCSWGHKYKFIKEWEDLMGTSLIPWVMPGWNSWDRSCCPGCLGQENTDPSCIGEADTKSNTEYGNEFFTSGTTSSPEGAWSFTEAPAEGDDEGNVTGYGTEWAQDSGDWFTWCMGICENYALNVANDIYNPAPGTGIMAEHCIDKDEASCGTWEVNPICNPFTEGDYSVTTGDITCPNTSECTSFTDITDCTDINVTSTGVCICSSPFGGDEWECGSSGFGDGCPFCSGDACCELGEDEEGCSDCCGDWQSTTEVTIDPGNNPGLSYTDLCYYPADNITVGGCCGWSDMIINPETGAAGACVFKGTTIYQDCANRCLAYQYAEFCVDNCQDGGSYCLVDIDNDGLCVGGQHGSDEFPNCGTNTFDCQPEPEEYDETEFGAWNGVCCKTPGCTDLWCISLPDCWVEDGCGDCGGGNADDQGCGCTFGPPDYTYWLDADGDGLGEGGTSRNFCMDFGGTLTANSCITSDEFINGGSGDLGPTDSTIVGNCTNFVYGQPGLLVGGDEFPECAPLTFGGWCPTDSDPALECQCNPFDACNESGSCLESGACCNPGGVTAPCISGGTSYSACPCTDACGNCGGNCIMGDTGIVCGNAGYDNTDGNCSQGGFDENNNPCQIQSCDGTCCGGGGYYNDCSFWKAYRWDEDGDGFGSGCGEIECDQFNNTAVKLCPTDDAVTLSPCANGADVAWGTPGWCIAADALPTDVVIGGEPAEGEDVANCYSNTFDCNGHCIPILDYTCGTTLNLYGVDVTKGCGQIDPNDNSTSGITGNCPLNYCVGGQGGAIEFCVAGCDHECGDCTPGTEGHHYAISGQQSILDDCGSCGGVANGPNYEGWTCNETDDNMNNIPSGLRSSGCDGEGICCYEPDDDWCDCSGNVNDECFDYWDFLSLPANSCGGTGWPMGTCDCQGQTPFDLYGSTNYDCSENCLQSVGTDCAGVCGGSATLDDCPVCICNGQDPDLENGCSEETPNSTCSDCHGVMGGSDVIDECEDCVALADFNSAKGCDGVCDSGLVEDICGKCGGTCVSYPDDCPDATCTCCDCDGEPNGPKYLDNCVDDQQCGGDCDQCSNYFCICTSDGVCIDTSCAIETDCHGACVSIADGGAQNDACSVCGGNNSTCSDCAGTPNGNAVVDNCGRCDTVGDISTNGVNTCYGGDETIYPDTCTEHSECPGNCGGPGIPIGFCDCNSNKLDCAGECGGTDVVGCDGDCGSGLVYDECGVCGGSGTCDCPNNNEDLGCNNICYDWEDDALVYPGAGVIDACGVCAGTGPADTCCEDSVVCDCALVNIAEDECTRCCCGGVLCDDLNTPCGIDWQNNKCDCEGNTYDCDGACTCTQSWSTADEHNSVCTLSGAAVLDWCGVCNGEALDSTSYCGQDVGDNCCDCEGTPFGNKIEDECGICGGTGINYLVGCCDCDCTVLPDCAGVCDGLSELDECGVCNGGGILEGDCDCAGNVEDCAGVCGGDSLEDNCGICDTDSSNDCTQDCTGAWGGSIEKDLCDVCGGNAVEGSSPYCGVDNDNTSNCCDCEGTPNGDAYIDPNCGDGASCVTTGTACTPDCNGVWGGNADLDSCDICGGNNLPLGDENLGCGCFVAGPSGCDNDGAGACGSILEDDCAGECGGSAEDVGCGCGESGPSGCDNQCGSTLENDECGVCDGDNTSCADCGGTPNGDSTPDNCDICRCRSTVEGNCSEETDCEQDCSGEWGGSRVVDDCGVCEGSAEEGTPYCGQSAGDNCCDCEGTPNGTDYIDNCEVCVIAGDVTCTPDCSGDWGGTLVEDECGVCDGGNSSCEDCAGSTDNQDCSPESQDGTGIGCASAIDGCTNCVSGATPGGASSNCALDCAGVWGGESSEDECGVCNGDNSSCVDCAGTPNGDAVEDNCGTCDSDSSNDCLQDCAGTWGGNAEFDECGVCNGDDSSCVDCAGEPNGNAYEDNCDYCRCGSPAAGNCSEDADCEQDCGGEWGGTKIYDDCGVCGGGGLPTGFCNCELKVCDCSAEDCADSFVGGTGGDAGENGSNACNGNAEFDGCGECGGDGTTCDEGCKDSSACNYCVDCPVEIDNCEYAEENYDCNGNCTAQVDCYGICAGDSTQDLCGVCNGPVTDCSDDLYIGSYCCDCAGEPNGNAYEDNCGVCDSDSSNDCEQDCAGTWGGTVVEDECGVCGGPVTDCSDDLYIGSYCCDCAGVPNGDSVKDECGTCDADASNNCIIDCAGVWGGTAEFDDCTTPVCSDGTTELVANASCLDCAGVTNGDAVEDNCGICNNDSSNDCIQDCAGEWGGTAEFDDCTTPVCSDGTTELVANASCLDCADVTNGDAVEDNCGICNNDSSNDCIQDCAGDWGGSAEVDECGICGGDDSSCVDCAGEPNGNAYEDNCGICDSDPTNDCVQDCQGTWGGIEVIDDCGVCTGNTPYQSGSCYDDCQQPNGDNSICADECGVPNGDNSTCSDCAGVPNGDSWESPCGCVDADNSGDECDDCAGTPNGDAELDDCGVCNGGNANQDCAGVCDGDAVLDNCNVCDADGSNDCTQDCAGVWGGTSENDECGVCDGDSSSCWDCANVPNGNSLPDLAGSCCDPGPSGCNNLCGSTAVNDSCGTCDGDTTGSSTGQMDCLGICDPGTPIGVIQYAAGLIYPTTIDGCGVCGGSNWPTWACGCKGTDGADGNNYPILGCDGVCGSDQVFDACSNCNGGCFDSESCEYCLTDGNNSSTCDSCADCANVPNGASVADACGVCNGPGIIAGECDCEGVLGNTPNYDDCDGACGGSAKFDCNSVCGGEAELNNCDVCWGGTTGNSATDGMDCLDVCWGNAVEDCNGACWGADDLASGEWNCEDCSGEWGGTAVIDECGDCGGSGIPDTDCACDGWKLNTCNECVYDNSECDTIQCGCDDTCYSHVFDECGVCGGSGIPDGECDCSGNVDLGCGCGESGPSGCDNTCGSTLENDECGICGGDNSSCADCAGVPNGDALEDMCGTCDDDSSNDCVQDCAGIWGGTNVTDDCEVCGDPADPNPDWDECGVCFSDGSSCADCAGVSNGNAVEDCLGVCNGSAVFDCTGTCDGGKTLDICDVCGTGYNTIPGLAVDGASCSANCKDCALECGGEKYEDYCGNCVSSSSEECISDCNGNYCNTGAVGCLIGVIDPVTNVDGIGNDQCGVCGGDGSSCKDCAGVPNGDSWESDCGCVEAGNSGDDCDDCTGTPNGSVSVDTCGICIGVTCFNGSNAGNDCPLGNVDCPGICGGSDNCKDCNDDINGTAFIDYCGTCVGGTGNTSLLNPGDNASTGSAYQCFNDNSCYDISQIGCGVELDQPSCDCNGNCVDECGLCGGDGIPDGACHCDGSINPGPDSDNIYCGCGSADSPTDGCDNKCGSTAVNDCNSVCDGLAILNECGICVSCLTVGCPENTNGMGDIFGRDCDGECFGNGVPKACCSDAPWTNSCGTCGNGIADGTCDCAGQEDLGCGCGEAGPSGCDNACGSIKELDYCGVCEEPGGGFTEEVVNNNCQCIGFVYDCDCCCGNGTQPTDDCGSCGNDLFTDEAGVSCTQGTAVDCTLSDGSCDCFVNEWDCAGVCGGDSVLDECGVCGGDGIADGECDCDGNVDLGCGCGEPGPYNCPSCTGTSEVGGTNPTPDGQNCDGVCGSTLVNDECGVCGGSGIPDGQCNCDGGVEDECSNCPGEGPIDCADECGGLSYENECDQCALSGNHDSCVQDCANVWNGSAMEDECGVCEGDNSTCTDCNGIINGEANVDDCDYCVGGDTDDTDGCGTAPCLPNWNKDCNNICKNYDGTAELDDCGVCVLDGQISPAWNASCEDCGVYPNGGATYDNCGDCICSAVDGNWGSLSTCLIQDACIQDCEGDWGGSTIIGICGKCGGGPDLPTLPAGLNLNPVCDCDYNIYDCRIDEFGEAEAYCSCTIFNNDANGRTCQVYDECGVCNGDGIADGACDCDGNVLDCTDNCGGIVEVDECGVCGGDGLSYCEGIIGFTSADEGEICGEIYYCPTGTPDPSVYGNESQCFTVDCNGDCAGVAIRDECDECVGGNTSCDAGQNSNLSPSATCATADIPGVCCYNYADKGCGCYANPPGTYNYDYDGDTKPDPYDDAPPAGCDHKSYKFCGKETTDSMGTITSYTIYDSLEIAYPNDYEHRECGVQQGWCANETWDDTPSNYCDCPCNVKDCNENCCYDGSGTANNYCPGGEGPPDLNGYTIIYPACHVSDYCGNCLPLCSVDSSGDCADAENGSSTLCVDDCNGVLGGSAEIFTYWIDNDGDNLGDDCAVSEDLCNMGHTSTGVGCASPPCYVLNCTDNHPGCNCTDNIDCVDCNDVCQRDAGGALFECGHGGDPNGTVDTTPGCAIVDNCGYCVQGNTTAVACDMDCTGSWGGDALEDDCGICQGDGYDDGSCDDGSCDNMDCAGECCGGTVGDDCTVDSNYTICTNSITGENVCCSNTDDCDECGICGGTNISCEADGFVCVEPTEDSIICQSGICNNCGICSGAPDGNSCSEGCDNVWCDGTNCTKKVDDCAGVCDGDGDYDGCGECDGPGPKDYCKDSDGDTKPNHPDDPTVEYPTPKRVCENWPIPTACTDGTTTCPYEFVESLTTCEVGTLGGWCPCYNEDGNVWDNDNIGWDWDAESGTYYGNCATNLYDCDGDCWDEGALFFDECGVCGGDGIQDFNACGDGGAVLCGVDMYCDAAVGSMCTCDAEGCGIGGAIDYVDCAFICGGTSTVVVDEDGTGCGCQAAGYTLSEDGCCSGVDRDCNEECGGDALEYTCADNEGNECPNPDNESDIALACVTAGGVDCCSPTPNLLEVCQPYISGSVCCPFDNQDSSDSNAPDCAGDCGGTAVVDECGTCDADSTNDCIQDCAYVWGGTAEYDACGECGGNGTACTDCNGDYCDNNSCLDGYDCEDVVCATTGGCSVDGIIECCGGNATAACTDPDECNICGGDNSTCSDECGVPNGDNSSCLDCAGVPNGDNLEDNCGACNADSTNDCVQDCAGEWGGSAVNLGCDCGEAGPEVCGCNDTLDTVDQIAAGGNCTWDMDHREDYTCNCGDAGSDKLTCDACGKCMPLAGKSFGGFNGSDRNKRCSGCKQDDQTACNSHHQADSPADTCISWDDPACSLDCSYSSTGSDFSCCNPFGTVACNYSGTDGISCQCFYDSQNDGDNDIAVDLVLTCLEGGYVTETCANTNDCPGQYGGCSEAQGPLTTGCCHSVACNYDDNNDGCNADSQCTGGTSDDCCEYAGYSNWTCSDIHTSTWSDGTGCSGGGNCCGTGLITANDCDDSDINCFNNNGITNLAGAVVCEACDACTTNQCTGYCECATASLTGCAQSYCTASGDACICDELPACNTFTGLFDCLVSGNDPDGIATDCVGTGCGVLDGCEVCNGTNLHPDGCPCSGGVKDFCDICGGDNTSCCNYNGTYNGSSCDCATDGMDSTAQCGACLDNHWGYDCDDCTISCGDHGECCDNIDADTCINPNGGTINPGACVCVLGVEGTNCDICVTGTCYDQGVTNTCITVPYCGTGSATENGGAMASTVCDCSCGVGTIGDNCNACDSSFPGYFGTYCQECDACTEGNVEEYPCTGAGDITCTTNAGCDNDTAIMCDASNCGTCNCKNNWTGDTCDTCLAPNCGTACDKLIDDCGVCDGTNYFTIWTVDDNGDNLLNSEDACFPPTGYDFEYPNNSPNYFCRLSGGECACGDISTGGAGLKFDLCGTCRGIYTWNPLDPDETDEGCATVYNQPISYFGDKKCVAVPWLSNIDAGGGIGMANGGSYATDALPPGKLLGDSCGTDATCTYASWPCHPDAPLCREHASLGWQCCPQIDLKSDPGYNSYGRYIGSVFHDCEHQCGFPGATDVYSESLTEACSEDYTDQVEGACNPYAYAVFNETCTGLCEYGTLASFVNDGQCADGEGGGGNTAYFLPWIYDMGPYGIWGYGFEISNPSEYNGYADSSWFYHINLNLNCSSHPIEAVIDCGDGQFDSTTLGPDWDDCCYASEIIFHVEDTGYAAAHGLSMEDFEADFSVNACMPCVYGAFNSELNPSELDCNSIGGEQQMCPDGWVRTYDEMNRCCVTLEHALLFSVNFDPGYCDTVYTECPPDECPSGYLADCDGTVGNCCSQFNGMGGTSVEGLANGFCNGTTKLGDCADGSFDSGCGCDFCCYGGTNGCENRSASRDGSSKVNEIIHNIKIGERNYKPKLENYLNLSCDEKRSMLSQFNINEEPVDC